MSMTYEKVMRTLHLGNLQFQSSFFSTDEKLSLLLHVKRKVLFAVLWFDQTKGHSSACVFWEVLKWPVLLLRAFSSSMGTVTHTVRRSHNHTPRDDMPNANSGNDLRGLCQLPTAAGRKPEDIRQRTYAWSESYLMLCGIDFFCHQGFWEERNRLGTSEELHLPANPWRTLDSLLVEIRGVRAHNSLI